MIPYIDKNINKLTTKKYENISYCNTKNENISYNINKNEIILPEEKHAQHKLLNNDLILKLDQCGFKNYSTQVRNCATSLTFSIQEHTQTKELRRRLKFANFCKFRFCATCGWRRRINLTRELLKAFLLIENERKVKYLFLTLTIRNRPSHELKESVQELNSAFKRMSERKVFKNAILGHFKAIEILGDHTKQGEVHPHLHVLLITPNSYFSGSYYIKQSKWSELWQKALRVDYTPIIDIRPVKAKPMSNLSQLQSAVLEVAKYATKQTQLVSQNDEDFKNIIRQTHKMRFYSSGGILKQALNLDEIDEDLVGLSQEQEALWQELYEEFYTWENGNYILREKIMTQNLQND